ncbi:FadR/GntR family transcriptional regulator [Pseudonocardia bannensis]|uniref:FadR family transcriptional regulator n=1 Tax=Pseudonocardia bannensis TaxID=630973 RepID=A0A848DFJ1_9PSEU|nr:FCD domain-containing protein [Pseudonocardia bannensis]NMH91387.1 FadR family transcriptional regulator [Pseudonocardia bannensis]
MISSTWAVGDVGKVLSIVQAMIDDGGLEPGTKLPTERELSEVAVATRSTVRRALQILEADHRIVRHVGRGTFVAAPQPMPNGLPTHDLKVSPAELMAARIMLEPHLMPLAIAAATEADVAEMKRCLAGGDKSRGYEEFELWDAALHRSFAMATHNGLLIAFSDAFNLSRAQPIWGAMKRRNFTAARRDAYLREHREIVAAVLDGDAQLAQHLMRTHLQHVRDNICGNGSA